MLVDLAIQSAGVAAGVFIGTLLGFGIRARRGNPAGLIGGSVLVTAVVAGLVGLAAMMTVTWLGRVL